MVEAPSGSGGVYSSNNSTTDQGYSGSNFSYVYHWLKSRGLSAAAVAAIMGNWHVESNFNPGAYNPNEGAVGLAQWEGGRRFALQQFASQRGTSEWDLKTQLEFFWHEFTGGYSRVRYEMSRGGSASELAAVFDAQYEGSAGTTRGARIAAAQHYYGGGFSDPGDTGRAHTNGAPPSGGGGAGFSGGGGGGGGETATNYSGAIDGFSSRVLNSIPALHSILDQARSGSWTVEHFINSVENSAWYRQHSDSARSAIASQISDPASWQQNLDHVVFQVQQLAGQAGYMLTHQEAVGIATNALYSGQDTDQAWLTLQIAHKQDYSHLNSLDNMTGQMAGTVQQLQQLAAQYGITPQDSYLARHASSIVSGQTTLDTYKQDYQTMAKSMFPALSDQIDRGITVADAAQPYIQSMSNLLEVDPASLSVFTPRIRRALQGTTNALATGSEKSTNPVLTPVWQFENQVRQDPRWQFTNNAHSSMADTLMQVGRDWGFE